MSFVDGFYSYGLSISDTNRDVYTSMRIKTPKHPYESMEHLTARVISLAHTWEDDLCFSEGLFNEKQPTLWKKDITEELLVWIQVGVPEKKKLLKALKDGRLTKFLIYFTEDSQKHEFCSLLRGSKSNWVEKIDFFYLDPEALTEISENTGSKSNWNITFSGSHTYIATDSREYEFDIIPLDIWEVFQDMLEN